MWTTVLVLAVAVNFEPTRIGLVPLILIRPRPLMQLFAFLCGCIFMTLSFGLLVLFVFHKSPLGTDKTIGATIQVVVGSLALVFALILASNFSLARNSDKSLVPTAADSAAGTETATAATTRTDKVSALVRRVLQRGNSPLLAAAVGLGVGLPSVDFMAVLIVIGASGAPPLAQAGALMTFLALGNAIVAVPLVSYLAAPTRTMDAITRFQRWIQARTRRDFAVLLAVIGCVMIAIGIRGL